MKGTNDQHLKLFIKNENPSEIVNLLTSVRNGISLFSSFKLFISWEIWMYNCSSDYIIYFNDISISNIGF